MLRYFNYVPTNEPTDPANADPNTFQETQDFNNTVKIPYKKVIRSGRPETAKYYFGIKMGRRISLQYFEDENSSDPSHTIEAFRAQGRFYHTRLKDSTGAIIAKTYSAGNEFLSAAITYESEAEQREAQEASEGA